MPGKIEFVYKDGDLKGICEKPEWKPTRISRVHGNEMTLFTFFKHSIRIARMVKEKTEWKEFSCTKIRYSDLRVACDKAKELGHLWGDYEALHP